ncbi:MAG TPA: ATP-binding protein, partial [Gillisia sp.]|nr:ATP-binding protein [Gillisia sp.]
MDEFRVGEIKTFKVLGIREDHEVKWIYLSDGIRDTYRIRPFDYQLEWESSNLPTMMECYVKQISIRGLPLLTQVIKNVLEECYTEEKEEYPFKLAGIKVDPNSGATFYELKDVYGLHHRYYPNSNEPSRIIGDIFNMRFESIEVKDRNRAYLLLSTIHSDQPLTFKPESDPRKESSLGFENDKREFKSSIVFPAGGISADIDEQLLIIAKTIAGFLNQEGGEIFLGVNDSGEVIGIDHEFKFLNSSERDNFPYQENKDGYENKIRTAVKYFLGNTANSNLNFE